MRNQGIKVSGEHEDQLPDAMPREKEKRGGHCSFRQRVDSLQS